MATKASRLALAAAGNINADGSVDATTVDTIDSLGFVAVSGDTMTGALNMGSNSITTTGRVLFSNLYSAESDLPSASTYHGMFAHVHGTGKAYYAHAGAWVPLAKESQLSGTSLALTGGTLTGNLTINTAGSSLPRLSLVHSNSGFDNFTLGAGVPGVSNSGFSIRDTDASANRLVISSTGNVGIATGLPTAPLQLNTAGNTADGTFYSTLTINNTGSNTWSRLRFDRSGVAKWGIALAPNDKFTISNLFTNGSTASPNDATFVIDNTGNVGIGTAAPAAALEIGGTDAVLLPRGTSAQRPSSPVNGMIRYNSSLGIVEEYRDGWFNLSAQVASSSGSQAAASSGGTITTYSSGGTNYKVHIFTSSGTFAVAAGAGYTAAYLIVAGGGGGGGHMSGGWYNDPGGGGGAGGMLTSTVTVTANTNYTVVVGAGGVSSSTGYAGNGGNSTCFSQTAIGGGGGGAGAANNATAQRIGQNGGSGGGGGGPANVVAVAAGGAGTSGQGNAGGAGGRSSPQDQISGGGGGRGGAGESAVFGSRSGVGGQGFANSLGTGSAVNYAGGGGGGGTNQGGVYYTAGRPGGTGGGGRGGDNNNSAATATAGGVNTGGGGGGAGGTAGAPSAYVAPNGGSGIVIIRYIV